MIEDPIYSLLSVESDIDRPRVLATGSLSACLDELKEAVLIDTVACNRAKLEIVATDPSGGKGSVVTVFQGYTPGNGA